MEIIDKKYNWAYGPTYRSKTDRIIVHHAAAETASPDDIHAWHLTRGWRGIAYNFIVRKNGNIYRGREENAQGGHTGNPYDAISIGICFEGNFDVETMSAAQLKAGQELLAYLRGKWGDLPVYKHRDFAATHCPGVYFPWDELVNGGTIAVTEESPYGTSTATVKSGSTGTAVKRCQWYLTELGYDVGEIDGDCGPKTVTGITQFQRNVGLDADGVCGPLTWAALEKALTSVIDSINSEEDCSCGLTVETYLAGLNSRHGSTWSQEARDWAVETGLFVGNDDGQFAWQGLLSREQSAILLKRFYDLLKSGAI